LSLQVWLPLNGDFNNYGVSNVSGITGTNTSFVDGKIGKCCKMGYTSEFTIPAFDKAKQISITYWCKVNTATSSQWLDMFHFKASDGTNTYWCRQELYSNCTLSGYFADAGGSMDGISCTVGEWIHYAFTLNFTTGEAKSYRNGVLFKQNTNINTSYYILSTNFRLGENGLDLSENDFRIYDHCLSPKEVKEISKCLVMHYPLDNNGIGNPNELANGMPINNASYIVAGTGWGTTVAMDNPVSPTGKVIRSTYTGSGGTQGGIHHPAYDWTTMENGATYTFSLWLRASKTINIYVYNEMMTSVSPSNLFTIGTDWTFVSATGPIDTSKSYHSNIIYCKSSSDITTNMWIECYGLKLEKGSKATPWCPHTSDSLYSIFNINGTTEFDTSGYKYNGTRSNVYTNADTPRYSCSSEFDGSVSYIQIPFNSAISTGENFTINLWFKKSELGSKNYETLIGGPSGFEMDTRQGTETTLSLYMSSHGGKVFTPFEFNTWYMVTMVNDGTNEMYYVNADLKKTITKVSMPTGNYFIGAWRDISSQNYKGLISDVRIYATPLSVADILELYNTGASIDNGGNLLTYDIQEK